MKNVLSMLAVVVTALLLAACDVHQWPEPRSIMPVNLHLRYETDFYVWEHAYDKETGVVSQLLTDGEGVDEAHPATTYRYDGKCSKGTMRYIVRAYRSGNRNAHAREFVFTRDIAEGYDCDVTIELEPGDYEILVWSDLTEHPGDEPYYDAADFRSIDLKYWSNYRASTDHRDSYRGISQTVSLRETTQVTEPDEASITMRRPQAKFEFIANDLPMFTTRELARRAAKAAGKAVTEIDLQNYTVRFFYINYVPVSYSAVSDRLVDSTTGLSFKAQLAQLPTGEVSLGFDYVLLNSNGTSVRVQIGIYDEDGEQVAMTPVVDVPLRRDHHTVMHGAFMTGDEPPEGSGGGVGLDPGFNGDFNMWV
ncbi:MAG: hypothetical protein J1E37_00145 [Prevotella sp.]|nr:hypothetical protein [Prevotella sp.]